MEKSKKFELEFIKKKKESKDAFSFYFKWPDKNFNFSPGQYIKIYLQIENADERGSSRYFTISSSPEEKEYIIITTKIIKSSYKNKLVNLKKGEKVLAFGPIGYFDFNLKSKQKNIFLAGGIGITPYISIIRTLDLLGNLNFSDIYLFAFFSNKENIVFYDELKKIEKKNKKLIIIYSLTKKRDQNFEYSRLSERLLNRYIKDFKNANYFISGSEKTVDIMFKTLIKIGILEENIFKEDFPGY